MKNKRIVSLLCLILTMISLMTSVVWAGVSGFEVNDGTGSTSSSGSGSSDWFALNGNGVITRSGTRYAIRVQNESGEYEDIGGDYYDLFWLNHLYNAYQKSNSDNDTGKASESMWSGSSYYYKNAGLDSTVKYPVRGMYKLFSGKKVFDTNASSLSDYTKSVKNSSGEEVEQARHVLTWILNEDRKNGTNKKGKAIYNMNIHTDGFGLNDADVIKLINFEEQVANFWLEDNNKGSNDKIREACEKVKDQIKQIRAGKLNIQIRAEILLRPRPAEDLKNKSVRGIDVSVKLRTIKDSSQYYYYLTFRECLALDKDGVNSNSVLVKYAGLLKETNEPWRSEEKYVEEAKKYGSNYWLGWDYIQIENPYQKNKTTVTETAILKNTDGSETILSGPTETKITEDKTFTRPENDYTYTGLVFDDGEMSSVTSQLVEADNGTHTIVYWYEVEKKTTITINYKDEKTGENICPSEMVEPGTHSKKDFDGYEYTGLEIIKPNPESKDPNKTSVTITDDKETHEIIFWYKPETKVTVEYVQRLSDGKEEEIVDLNGAPIKIDKYLKTGEQATFLSTQINMVSQNYQYIEVRKDGAKQEEKPETIIITGDGENHSIVFVYEKRVQIKVMGVYEVDGKVKSTTTLKAEESKILPLNEKYNINDYANKWDSYELCEGTPYFIQENSLTYMGATEDAKVKNQKTINITVDKNSKRGENTVNSILVIIYFEPKYTVDVYHWDIANQNEPLAKYLNIPLTANKEIKSYNASKYINLYYEWDQNGSKFDAPISNGQYTVTVDESKCKDNHRLDFYYVSQQVEVRYVLKENNVEIAERETKSLGEISKKDITNYTYANEYKLNGTTGSGSKVTVGLNTDISGNQTLVFYYEINDAKVNGTGGMQLGVIPSNLNNQLIDKNNTTKYWVLNNYGTLEIKFEKGADTNVSASETVDITFPFDIYRANGTRIDENTSSQFTFTYTTSGSVCTGTTEKVYIPIWVEEKMYDNGIKVSYDLNYQVTTYDYSGTSFTTSTSTIAKPVNATASVEVVGAVYDFTITNLDGADLTGDTMWKKALFGTGEGYKATETAVGQATQQSKNYNYGIKRGTRFYFSLNTLGAKNKKIEIEPSFYYVSADGTQTKVTMKSNYLNETRSISLTDTNRTTTEFKNERAKKVGKTSTTIFTVGNYNKITLDSNVNTPYLGIASELTVKDVKSGVTLSDYANHWYGDYSIPNDAKFYKADGTLVSDETGVVVVYFEIKTLDNKNAEYLAYDGHSPFVQTEKISEWKYERQNKNLSTAFNNSMTMPKVSTSAAKVVDEVWKKDNSTAAIIYSLRASATTKQNVTSVGTH